VYPSARRARYGRGGQAQSADFALMAMRPNVRGGRRNLVLAFGVGVVAAIVVIVLAAVLTKKNAPDVVAKPVVNLSGIPQQNTILGRSGAKVTLIEYADQQCPGCRFYTLNIFPALVKEYIRPGKIDMRYHGFPFIGDDSRKALRFLLAAGLQNRLWQLQETLYRHQGAENSGWITDDLIRKLGSQIAGLDVDRLFADAASDAISKKADEQLRSADDAEIPVTPTFFIQIGTAKPYYIRVSDVTQFREALNDALNG
jgi:protein-disulfide isomerase